MRFRSLASPSLLLPGYFNSDFPPSFYSLLELTTFTGANRTTSVYEFSTLVYSTEHKYVLRIFFLYPLNRRSNTTVECICHLFIRTATTAHTDALRQFHFIQC